MNSPAFSGSSCGFDRRNAASLDRRMADPVLEPELLRPSASGSSAAARSPRRRGAPDAHGRARRAPLRDAPRSGPIAGSTTCTSVVPSGFSQCSGASRRRRRLGRARGHALPELGREAVERRLRHAQRLQPVVGEGDREPRARAPAGATAGPSPTRFSSRRTRARPAVRSSMRSRMYVPTYGEGRSCSAPLWMSSSSRADRVVAGRGRARQRSGGTGARRRRRVRVRRGQVGEGLRRRPRRRVDAVADGRPVPGVDDQREQAIHDVVVERPAAARLVLRTAERGDLRLEEGALLDVRLRDVDDEVVGEQELGQRVDAVAVEGQSTAPSRPSQKARLAFSRAR